MTMRCQVNRFYSDGESTNGVFSIIRPRDSFAACFSLEDEHRTSKIWGETRIPAGIYRLGLNVNENPGSFHRRYGKRFGSWHRGMIEVLNVPGFTGILIHIGNDDDDTAGCLLLGEATSVNWVSRSTDAYCRMYEKMILPILSGEDCWIHYLDSDLAV